MHMFAPIIPEFLTSNFKSLRELPVKPTELIRVCLVLIVLNYI